MSRKKVVALCLSILILWMNLFSESHIVLAINDTENPVIAVDTLTVDKTEAELGESVKISIKITDNVAIDDVSIRLDNANTEKEVYGKMTYNQQSRLYEYVFKIDKDIPAGPWKIAYIAADDTSSNHVFQLFSDTLFHVTNEMADSESPIIHKETLLLDKQEVGMGECVTISIKITDNTEISNVWMSLSNTTSDKSMYPDMFYNPQSMRYEYRFIVTPDTIAGNWIPQLIYAYDTTGNVSVELFEDYFHVSNELTNLEQWPLYTKTLKVNKNTIKVDDYVNISIKATNSVEIATMNIEYENISTGKTILKEMTYNEQNGLYESKFVAKDDTLLGNWRINYISVEDKSGKKTKQMFDKVFLVEAKDLTPSVPEQSEPPISTPPTKEPPTATPSPKPSDPPKAEQDALFINGADNKVYGDSDFQLSASGGSTNGKVTYSVPKQDGVLAIEGNTAKILKAGTTTITATKAGNNVYKDIFVTEEITIFPRDIANTDISITGIENDYFYTGKEIIPDLILTDTKADICTNDYEIIAYDNIEGGLATIVIRGKNNYTGTINENFYIIEANSLTPLGDVNCDGVISLTDAQFVLKMVLHSITPYGQHKRVANVNKDERIDLKDVQLIMKKALHIINNYDDVYVESIQLSPSTKTIAVGSRFTLTAKVTPANAVNGQVTWKSSNKAIATVENGVVKGISPGEVIITATAGPYNATCTIKVLPGVELHNNTLKNYILRYGATDLDGNHFIQEYMQINPKEFFIGTITYIASSNRFKFECDELYQSSTRAYTSFTTMEYSFKEKYVTPTCMYFADKPYFCTEYTYTTFDIATYRKVDNKQFQYSFITGSERQDILVQIEANGLLDKAFIIWDYMLASKVKLNMKMIGFQSYETLYP